MPTPASRLVALAALAAPLPALAHGFGRLYNLPVPLWLYAWGAGATLIVSFLLIGWFATAPPLAGGAPAPLPATREPRWAGALHRAAPALRALAVLLLLLCIATGWFGYRDPYRNFSMTFFWVVFVLGFTYLAALLGDFYAALNPWRTLAGALERLWRGYARGRVRYPDALGDWPALALYLAFIAFELFGHGKPFSLATMLAGYTLLNLVAVGLVGARAWFAHGEFFSLFLRLAALAAPLAYERGEAGTRGRLRWRAPLAGLVEARAAHLSTVAFALAMLSTTAFDGLRATQAWVALFWRDPTGLVTALAGARPYTLYAQMRTWFIGWEAVCLALSPFVYLAAYLAAIALGKALARSDRPLRALALDFGLTLIPIALVYHFTHYATLLLSQGLKVVSLASDPFGWGWNLFGTLTWLRRPILPSMALVWHAQVGLILAGHVASVYVAHRIALRVFPTRRAALLSQLPMLALMVGLTVSGLWILAQPLTAELMR